MRILFLFFTIIGCGLAFAQIEEEDLLTQKGEVSEEHVYKELEDLAKEHYIKGRLREAALIYKQIAQLVDDPEKRNNYLVYAAWLFYEDGSIDDSRELLEKVFMYDPKYVISTELFSESFVDLTEVVRSETLSKLERISREKLKIASDLWHKGDLKGSLRLVEEVIALFPSNYYAYYLKGLIFAKSGDYRRAEQLFNKVIMSDEADKYLKGETFKNLAIIAYKNREFAKAFEFAIKSSNIQESAYTYYLLALSARELGKGKEALAFAQKSFEMEGYKDKDKVALYGDLLIDNEQWLKAIAVLGEAVKKFADDDFLWYLLAKARRGLGAKEEAYAALHEAIRLNKGKSVYYRILLNWLFEDEKYSEIVTLIEKDGIILGKLDQKGIYIVAVSFDNIGKTRKAISIIEDNVNDSSSKELWNLLGSLYIKIGEKEKAKKAFEKALALDPTYDVALENLSKLETPVVARTKRDVKLNYYFEKLTLKDLKIRDMRGVVIKEVPPGFPFSLKKGDLILRVDDDDVYSVESFIRKLRRKRKSTLTVLREGEVITIFVRVEE